MNQDAGHQGSDPSLVDLGWDEEWEGSAAPWHGQGFVIGRVAAEDRGSYVVLTAGGERRAEVSGRYLYAATAPSDFPKVGDWAVLSTHDDSDADVIHAILRRRSWLSRKTPGEATEEQVLAANIDVIFVVQGLDHDFNLRRLERHLVMIHEGGARPAVVLNKADLQEDHEPFIGGVRSVSPGVEILTTSAVTGFGVDRLAKFIREGQTYAFIGSSGAGKSSLINRLLGRSHFRTEEVRGKDSRGRHTTARRELVRIPGGGLLIDTPGIREFRLWDGEGGVDETYAEIAALAAGCRYSDCTHSREAGCAVLRAVEEGHIPRPRYESYLKLRKELAYLEARQKEKKAQRGRKSTRTSPGR
jgi:ribosome biogenesis GTPase